MHDTTPLPTNLCESEETVLSPRKVRRIVLLEGPSVVETVRMGSFLRHREVKVSQSCNEIEGDEINDELQFPHHSHDASTKQNNEVEHEDDNYTVDDDPKLRAICFTEVNHLRSEVSPPPLLSHDASTIQNNEVKHEYDDGDDKGDDGTRLPPAIHLVEENKLRDGGDRFDDDHAERDEHNKESQLPLLSHDASTKQSNGVELKDDSHAGDNGDNRTSDDKQSSPPAEENKLKNGGDRFDDYHFERVENNEESQLPLLSHDASTKQSIEVEINDDGHAGDDGDGHTSDDKPSSPPAEENKLRNADDRFDDDHVERDEHNEESQLPLLSHDASTKQSNGVELNDDGYTSDDGADSSPFIHFLKKKMNSLLSIYTDQSGSFSNFCHGFSIIILSGIFLGIVMPHDEQLPSPWYRVVSSIIGYTYFTSWSVSYYPQIIMIYETGSTNGLSSDNVILATLNCVCYALYNSFFFWDKQIRQEYEDAHPDTPITVESNDVAFAIHALFVSIALTSQVAYYNGFRTSPLSSKSIALITVLVFASGIYIIGILLPIRGFRWINFLHGMAILKIVLASASYIPQLLLNYERKSTCGWNMWSIYLDFGGGLFSMWQIIFDSIDLGDFWSGIMGNWAKLILGMLTLGFDSAFLIQHYVLYCDAPTCTSDVEHDYTLLEENEIV